MEKDDFKVYLVASSYWAVKLAQLFVKDIVPFEFVYDVKLNQSMDERCGDEFVCYPEDEGKVFSQQNVDKVVELLARDGRVPVWIDISVTSVTKQTTTLELFCAGRYTNNKERMYYAKQGQGPFGIKSPALPQNWETGKKFNLMKKKSFLFRF